MSGINTWHDISQLRLDISWLVLRNLLDRPLPKQIL